MISLVWNLPNGLAAPCGSDEGLTETGRRFFKRAQALGMLVDVSHLSEKGFWDMIELAEKPGLRKPLQFVCRLPAPAQSDGRPVPGHLRSWRHGGTEPLRAVPDASAPRVV